MSYDIIATIDQLSTGDVLDGHDINDCFGILSEIARSLAADVVGRCCWLTGGELSGNYSGGVLYGEMTAGDFYVTEPGALHGYAIRDATRSRQPIRSVLLPPGQEVLVSIAPHDADAQLGALVVNHLSERPPEGAVPLAWLGTGFTDIRSSADGRPHRAWGAVVECGGSEEIRNRSTWIPIPAGRLVASVYAGEQLEILCACTVTDGLAKAYGEDKRDPKQQRDMSQFQVALNGVVLDVGATIVAGSTYAAPLSFGWDTTSPSPQSYYAEWLIDPFAVAPYQPTGEIGSAARVFASSDPTQGGIVLVELVARGFSVLIESLWFYVRVRPKEVTLV